MKINAKILAAVLITAFLFFISSDANSWSVFSKGEKEVKKDKPLVIQIKPGEIQKEVLSVPPGIENIPIPKSVPGIYTPLTKDGANLLTGMTGEQIEMLRNLLTRLYQRNKNLSEAFGNIHWKGFTREDLITPGTETNTLRKVIKHNIAYLNWDYASLIYVFSNLFDNFFKHPDGTPFEPGDTKSFLWGDDNPVTRDVDEGDVFGMTEEDVLSWMFECRGHTSCVNNVPIMKWNIWYVGDVVSGIGTSLTRPESSTEHITGYGSGGWRGFHDRQSENLADIQDLWKRTYESPRLFNEPMPVE